MISVFLNLFIKLFEKYPQGTILVCTSLTVGFGASVGAFAMRSMVNEKHAVAMSKIQSLEERAGSIHEKIESMDNKLDILLKRSLD